MRCVNFMLMGRKYNYYVESQCFCNVIIPTSRAEWLRYIRSLLMWNFVQPNRITWKYCDFAEFEMCVSIMPALFRSLLSTFYINHFVFRLSPYYSLKLSYIVESSRLIVQAACKSSRRLLKISQRLYVGTFSRFKFSRAPCLTYGIASFCVTLAYVLLQGSTALYVSFVRR